MPLYQEASVLVDTLIQKCGKTSSITTVRKLHARILTSIPTFAKTPFVYNNLITMYARCSSFKDSLLVFDQMPQRNFISYNSIINACSRTSTYPSLAFELLLSMQNEGFTPSALTFTSLLQASSSLDDQLLGTLVQAQCIKCGVLDDVCVHTALLGFYSGTGNVESAKKVFCMMGVRECVAWNFVICGCVKNGEVMEGIELFGSMRKENVWPNEFTFAMVLNGCSKLKDSWIGKVVHAQLIVSGTFVDLRLHNALLEMYCSCGLTASAYEIFRRIKNVNLVSCNTMLAGYAANEDGEGAMSMFVQLVRASCATPDEYTLAAVVSATRNFPASDYGKPLHALIEKAGLQKRVHVCSSMISMYFKNGDSRSAEKIFHSVIYKDVVLWTNMIAGHCRTNDMESAIRLFRNMLQNGHEADSYVLSVVLYACTEPVTLRQGEVITSMAIKSGYATEMSVCGSLIDMYTKSGELHSAESILSTETGPDLHCCNAMFGGYGQHGKSIESFRVYDEILRNNLTPGQVKILSLFATCSHCGLVDEAKRLWNHMEELQIKPGPKQYSCMVSLLSRAGLLEEAKEFILKSPSCDDYLESWRTLLSASIAKENAQIGIQAAEHILSIDKENSAAHMLLANLYAAMGRWDVLPKEGGRSEVVRRARIKV